MKVKITFFTLLFMLNTIVFGAQMSAQNEFDDMRYSAGDITSHTTADITTGYIYESRRFNLYDTENIRASETARDNYFETDTTNNGDFAMDTRRNTNFAGMADNNLSPLVTNENYYGTTRYIGDEQYNNMGTTNISAAPLSRNANYAGTTVYTGEGQLYDIMEGVEGSAIGTRRISDTTRDTGYYTTNDRVGYSAEGEILK